MQAHQKKAPPTSSLRRRAVASRAIVAAVVGTILVSSILAGLNLGPANADQPASFLASGTPAPLSAANKLYLPLVLRVPEAAPAATATNTQTATPTPTETPTSSPTATNTATATATTTPTATNTPTNTPTATSTPTNTPTNTPTPTPTSTDTPQPVGDEILIYDWNRPVGKWAHGFPRDYPPLPIGNGDWTSPINFAQGTLYYRVQIRSQPEPQQMKLQFCFWQFDYTREECGPMTDVYGAPGTQKTWSAPVDRMWEKYDPIDWSQPRQTNGVAIKNSAGEPVSDWEDWNWNGEDPDLWYPLDMRFSVVVVAQGKTFSGWSNYP